MRRAYGGEELVGSTRLDERESPQLRHRAPRHACSVGFPFVVRIRPVLHSKSNCAHSLDSLNPELNPCLMVMGGVRSKPKRPKVAAVITPPGPRRCGCGTLGLARQEGAAATSREASAGTGAAAQMVGALRFVVGFVQMVWYWM